MGEAIFARSWRFSIVLEVFRTQFNCPDINLKSPVLDSSLDISTAGAMVRKDQLQHAHALDL